MTIAHKFDEQEINKILDELAGAKVVILEDNENLEVEFSNKLIYFSGEKSPSGISVASITVDIFLNNDDLDNDEAYVKGIIVEQKDATESSISLIERAIKEIKEMTD